MTVWRVVERFDYLKIETIDLKRVGEDEFRSLLFSERAKKARNI